MFKIDPIGFVESSFKESAPPEEMRKHQSTIVIKPELADGLYKIERNQYLQIIFYFDQSEGYNLKGPRYHGKERGVFASRSPRRPNPIGVTTVELIKVEGNKLTVDGLDALDGTPVIDIKPYADVMDKPAVD